MRLRADDCKLAWKLIKDESFRSFVYGAAYDQLSLLTPEDVHETATSNKLVTGMKLEEAELLVSLWDSSSFLDFDNRLHKLDFARFVQQRSSSVWRLEGVPERIKAQTVRILHARDALSKMQAQAGHAHKRECLIDRLTQAAALHWYGFCDVQPDAGATVNIAVSARDANTVEVSVYGFQRPDPTILMTFAGLDDHITGEVSFSESRLAFIQRGFFLRPSEILSLCLPHKVGKSILYWSLLNELSIAASEDSYDEVHADIRGWRANNGYSSSNADLIMWPDEVESHPVFDNESVLALSAKALQRKRLLLKLSRSFDTQHRGGITRTSFVYALKGAHCFLPDHSIDTLVKAYQYDAVGSKDYIAYEKLYDDLNITLALLWLEKTVTVGMDDYTHSRFVNDSLACLSYLSYLLFGSYADLCMQLNERESISLDELKLQLNHADPYLTEYADGLACIAQKLCSNTDRAVEPAKFSAVVGAAIDRDKAT